MSGDPGAALVVRLHAASAAAAVGVKAATLGALARAGLAVPEGLVLTTRAAQLVMSTAGLGAGATPEEVLRAPLPAAVEAALGAVAAHFGDQVLAVRSSAPDEDLPEASFAGQYDSVLQVRRLEALRGAVRRCWASAYGPRSRAYGPGHEPAPLAVLVQHQVDADVAGVAVSANPLTADDEVLVSAVPGLADSLVAGRETPDEWVVKGVSARLIRAEYRALAEPQVRAVAALARRAAEVLGGPQDIEWAMAGGRLTVLQSRPVTALPVAPEVELPPGTWIKDVEHYAAPFTSLGASLAAPAVAEGLSSMYEAWGGSLERMEVRIVGGEAYLRPVPLGGRDGPPPWWVLGLLARVVPAMRRRSATARRMVRPEVFARLLCEWELARRPALQADAARLRRVDLAALDDPGLLAHLDEVVAVARTGLHQHFRLIPIYTVSLFRLTELCREGLGWTEEEVLALVAGMSGPSSEPNRALAELAGRVADQPSAAAAVASAGSDVADRLNAAAPELGSAFAEWCDRYAYRCVHDDPGSPLWIERPGLIAELLCDLIERQRAGRMDPSEVVGTGREAATDRARAALARRPWSVRARFEEALAAARRYYPLREDTAFWGAGIPGGLVRRTVVEVGRRLAARGDLPRAGDVVHLDLETLRAAIGGEAPTDLRALVNRSRAERAWVDRHPGPAFLGPPPATMPDLRALPEPARTLNRALAWAQPRPAKPDIDGSLSPGGLGLQGTGASPGRYTGPARIVRDEADFVRLRPGDVLVCATADPSWSMLFGRVGALVTDHGGLLSHAAIVAREHGIPAVVGVGGATAALCDGDLVGSSGVGASSSKLKYRCAFLTTGRAG